MHCAGWERKATLLLCIVFVGGASSCPTTIGTDGVSGEREPLGIRVILKIENLSGVPAIVTARFSIDASNVRETVRRLSSSGNESTAELLPTRARFLDVVALVDDSPAAASVPLIEPGTLLKEGHFVWLKDFNDGDTLVFIIPPLFLPPRQIIDCNSNGIEDFTDIASGTSMDCNSNNIPDECDICDEGRGIGIPEIHGGITPSGIPGPLLIGGDDTDNHGFFFQGVNQFGWLYIQKGFDYLGSQVRNTNKTVVCLGCNAPRASDAFESGFDHSTLPGQGWQRSIVVGDSAIADFFDGNGAVNVNNTGIIYMPTDAGNISGGITAAELAQVNSNASEISDFVAGGGGVFAHDQDSELGGFGWLSELLPELVRFEPDTCDNMALHLTPEGSAIFPALDDSIMSVATPWHGRFSGDFGDLQVLMTAPCGEGSVPVIFGSPIIPLEQFALLSPVAAINTLGDAHIVTAVIVNEASSPIAGVLVSFNIVDGPNVGLAAQVTTNATGQATFTYTGSGGAGRDEIVASFFDGQITKISNSAFKFWLPRGCSPDCDKDGVPDECQIAASPSLDVNGDSLLDACESQPTSQPAD